MTPSIGIALYPEHGTDAQTLLKNADGAMYEAKASGRNQFRVYTSAVNARALKRLSLEMELRRAFENAAAGALLPAEVRHAQPEGRGRGGAVALVPPAARPDSDRRLRRRGRGDRADRRHRPLDAAAGVPRPASLARRRAHRAARSPSTCPAGSSCARTCCCAYRRWWRRRTCRRRCSSSSSPKGS